MVGDFSDEIERRGEKNDSLVVEVGDEYATVTEDGQVSREVQLTAVTTLRSAVTAQWLSVRTDDADALHVVAVTALTDDIPTADQRNVDSELINYTVLRKRNIFVFVRTSSNFHQF